MEEPENADAGSTTLLDQFEASGMGEQPACTPRTTRTGTSTSRAALPKRLTDDQHRRILGQNASDLYGVELFPDSGYSR